MKIKLIADYVMFRNGRVYEARREIMRGKNYDKLARRFHVSRIEISEAGFVYAIGWFPDLRARYGRPCRSTLWIGHERDVLVVHDKYAKEIT